MLKAMGVAPEVGGGAIRLSLGCGTTEAEIDQVLDQIVRKIDVVS